MFSIASIRRFPWFAGLLLGLAATLAPQGRAHVFAYNTDQFQDGANLGSHIEYLATANHAIHEIGVEPDGDWIVVSEWGVASSPSFSPAALSKVKEFLGYGWTIDAIAFTQAGDGWVVVADQGYWYTDNIPSVRLLSSLIDGELRARHRIKDLSFAADGWVITSTGGLVYAQHVPADLFEALVDLGPSQRTLCQVTMATDGSWLVIADDWYASSGLPTFAIDSLRLFQREQWETHRIALLAGGSFILYSQGFYASPKGFLGRMEYGMVSDKNIWDLMDEMDIPGLSVAFVEDWEVQWARGYGELEAGTQRALYTTHLMDMASCSKPLGAMTILQLTEGGGAPLTLDTSVQQVMNAGPAGNALEKWLEFSLGDLLNGGDWTSIWAWAFTLRRLLSHSASLEPWASTPLYPGDDVPETWEKLRGWSKGNLFRNSRRVRYNRDFDGDGKTNPPGTVYRYSGGGFLVADAMAEIVAGVDFDDYMRDTLIAGLELQNTTVHQPLLPEFEGRAAIPHSGMTAFAEDDRPFYTWTSAGGVYGSPSDVARAVITLMNFGMNPEGTWRFLEASTVEEMLTDQAPGDRRYGLGLSLSANQVTRSNGEFFAHTGSHPGAKTRLGGNPTSGEGIVIAINAGHDEAADFHKLIYDLFKLYHGW